MNDYKNTENNLLAQLDEMKRRLENETAPHVVMEKLKREIQLMKEQHNYTVQQVIEIPILRFTIYTYNYLLRN